MMSLRYFAAQHSGIAAAALVTCSATYPIQAGESRLPCTVGLGTGLPCWRLSAGCWFRTEITMVWGATCLLCAKSEQHFRWPIIRCRRSAYMEWAAVQSTWHWAIADYFQWTSEDLLVLHRVLRPRRICDFYDFFARHINVLTYLLTYFTFSTFGTALNNESLMASTHQCTTQRMDARVLTADVF